MSSVDLHDAAGLAAADRAMLLPSVALAGAQVRATAEQVSGFADFGRPRALVVVGANAAVDTALLTALVGDAPAPVVAGTALPLWVGPLDIVVVLASLVDDIAAAEAAALAVRRGARVIVRAAGHGPVAEAAAGADLLEPPVPVTEALAGPARLVVLAGVAAAAGFGRRPDFLAAADQLDALAVACHPSSEFFVNPALTLAEHLSAGTPLIVGTDPVADALAGYTCRALATLSGTAAAALLSYQAAGSPPVLASAARTDGPAGTFYDPYLDGDGDEEPGQTVSSVLVVGPTAQGGPAGTVPSGAGLLPLESLPAFGAEPVDPVRPAAPRSPLAAALQTALPRSLTIGPEELPTRDDGPTDPDAPVPVRDAFSWTLAMMARVDFAAVYLGLRSGARAPLDSPDGLGRPGGAALHLPGRGRDPGRGAAGRGPWNERESGSWS
ncbi:hypothetical protein [Nakamurella sp.]|uniref:hypothetical protein n=1 Tax=Nakamurella sp. TaxID=1869182 RepID=UPI003B3B51FF